MDQVRQIGAVVSGAGPDGLLERVESEIGAQGVSDLLCKGDARGMDDRCLPTVLP